MATQPVAQTPNQIAEARNPSQYNANYNPGGTLNAPTTSTIPAQMPVVNSNLAETAVNNARNTASNMSSGATTQTQNNQQTQQQQIDKASQQLKDDQIAIAAIQEKWNNEKQTATTNASTNAATSALATPQPEYITETRTDGNGNPYTVRIPNPQYVATTTTPQTTAQTDPQQAWNNYQAAGGKLNITTWENSGRPQSDTTNADGTPMSPAQIIQNNSNIAIAQQQDIIAKGNNILQQYLNGSFPLTPDQQAQLTALSNVWDASITSQTDANQTYLNSANMASARAGGEYSPTSAMAASYRAIQTGLNDINSLQQQKAVALAKLKQSFIEQDYKASMDNLNLIKDADKNISDTIQKAADSVRQINKDAADDLYNRVTKPIQDIAVEAAKNGLKDTSKITKATSVEDAITAAGGYLQTGTGDMADYLQYKRNKENNGLTALSYDEWYNKKIADQLKIDSNKAYATSYASTKAKNDANAVANLDANGNPIIPVDANPDAKEILGQTGLSKLQFDYLTTGTKALTRLTQKERLEVISSTGEWLKKHGVDSSTFIAQYEAYNKTLENNIKRVNQVKVSEGELKGTLNNLDVAADDSTFSSMKWANIVKLFAGQEFNDSNVSRYAFHLTQLRSELAMYNAAAAGKIGQDGQVMTDDGDKAEATRIIRDGFAAGSIKGFNDALVASVGKMDTVLNSSVNSARQNVWKLFGVGQNYHASYDTPEQYLNTSPSNEKSWVEAKDYLKSQGYANPTAEEVFQYLMSK